MKRIDRIKLDFTAAGSAREMFLSNLLKLFAGLKASIKEEMLGSCNKRISIYLYLRG